MMKIDQLPRTALHQGIKLTRLPLTTFEAVARRGQDNETWGPAVLFERAEVAVKERVGSLVRDDRLRTEAILQRAKLQRLAEAAAKEQAAAAAARQADEELHRREEAVETRRQRAEEDADRRKAELERRKAEARADVEERVDAREEAVEKITQTQERAVDKQETAAERRRLAAEAAVLGEKERAAAAKGEVVALDEAVKRTKQARRA